MKNIHLLPTDQPSRLHEYGSYSSLGLSKEYLQWKLAKNVYISSDEETKEGWYINKSTNQIIKRLGYDENWKYIMLTTDQDLIKNGVQAINNEFLEWFVKNPTCENIYVEEFNYYDIPNWDYVITIPKEKSKEELLQLERKEFDDFAAAYAINKAKEEVLKNTAEKLEVTVSKELQKQETLLEAAEKYAESKDSSSIFKAVHKKDFINGGKWQQEEICKSEFLQKLRATLSDIEARILIFETFKNK